MNEFVELARGWTGDPPNGITESAWRTLVARGARGILDAYVPDDAPPATVRAAAALREALPGPFPTDPTITAAFARLLALAGVGDEQCLRCFTDKRACFSHTAEYLVDQIRNEALIVLTIEAADQIVGDLNRKIKALTAAYTRAADGGGYRLWQHYHHSGCHHVADFPPDYTPDIDRCDGCGLDGRWLPLYIGPERFGPADQPVTRRQLAEQGPPPKAWDQAAAHAARTLGADVAARIRWSRPNQDGAIDDHVYGDLTGDDFTLRLRYDLGADPVSTRLEVNVRCPEHGDGCAHGWDNVERRADLLLVLGGGEPDDPYCDRTAARE